MVVLSMKLGLKCVCVFFRSISPTIMEFSVSIIYHLELKTDVKQLKLQVQEK